jgi:hypothetical protein
LTSNLLVLFDHTTTADNQIFKALKSLDCAKENSMSPQFTGDILHQAGEALTKFILQSALESALTYLILALI